MGRQFKTIESSFRPGGRCCGPELIGVANGAVLDSPGALNLLISQLYAPCYYLPTRYQYADHPVTAGTLLRPRRGRATDRVPDGDSVPA